MVRINLLMATCMLFIAPAFSQIGDPRIPLEETLIYETYDQPPSFPGGEKKFRQYLKKKTGIRQTDKNPAIPVSFVVRMNGSIDTSSIHILSAVSQPCSVRIIKALKEMPDWQPGKVNNRTVNVRYKMMLHVGKRCRAA